MDGEMTSAVGIYTQRVGRSSLLYKCYICRYELVLVMNTSYSALAKNISHKF